MKYIINNKWMDTEESTFITRYEIGRYEYTIYVTKKGNYFLEERDLHRGGALGLSCSKDKAIELTKKHSPYSVKKFFPEIISCIEEG